MSITQEQMLSRQSYFDNNIAPELKLALHELMLRQSINVSNYSKGTVKSLQVFDLIDDGGIMCGYLELRNTIESYPTEESNSHKRVTWIDSCVNKLLEQIEQKFVGHQAVK